MVSPFTMQSTFKKLPSVELWVIPKNICNYLKTVLPLTTEATSLCTRDRQPFSTKGQKANILGFAGCLSSLCCHYSTAAVQKQPSIIQEGMSLLCSNKISFMETKI